VNAIVVDGKNVRVIERSSGFRLSLEACNVIGIGRRLRQRLERDVAIELEVFGKVHAAHAALADLANDPVVSDGLADHASALRAPRSISVRSSAGGCSRNRRRV
jgi:hypothetical protein